MKKIFLILVGAMILNSCEDATDIIQPGELGPDRAFITVNDLQTGIFGVYSTALTDWEIELAAIFTDESAVGSSNGGSNLALHTYQLNPNVTVASEIWRTNYNLILRANILLEAATNIVPNPAVAGEQDTYDNAVGQALALRAYGHSRLLSHYGVDLEDRASLGVPVIDFVPAPTFKPSRNTVGEVYDFIQSDLTEAERLFTAAGTGEDVFFTSNNFVRALRARTAAYAGDVPTMIAAANSVLSNFTLPAQATPATTTDYRQIWTDELGAGAQEIIFKLAITQNNVALSNIWNTNRSDVDGAPLYEMSRNVFDLLEANRVAFGDIRRQTYIDATSTIVADYDNDPNPRDNDRLIVDKYPGNLALPGLAGAVRNDIKVFRTVEMHFILAEAAIRNNQLVEAERQIRIVRNARYTSPAPVLNYSNPVAAWADLLLERRLELWAEGHRYVDIKRLGRKANIGYDRNETDCTLYAAAVCDLPPTEFITQYLPIPQNEINGNGGIQQNPNY